MKPRLEPTQQGPTCSKCGSVVNLNHDPGMKHHTQSYECEAISTTNRMLELGLRRYEEMPTRSRWLVNYLEVRPETARTRRVDNRLGEEYWVAEWIVLLGKTFPADNVQYKNPRKLWSVLAKKIRRDEHLQETLSGAYRIKKMQGLALAVKIELQLMGDTNGNSDGALQATADDQETDHG